jgi:hypothetical protein
MATQSQNNKTTNQNNPSNNQKNKPVEKWKIGNIDCTIWNNTINKDNKTFTKESISLRKSWKQDNEWKEQKVSLSLNDIQKALLLLSKAQQYLLFKSSNSNGNAGISDFE